jgi:putative ABC transport system permease protein
MNTLHQIITVTALGLRSLQTRFKPSLVVVVGLVCAVGVLLSTLSLVESVQHALLTQSDPGLAIVLSAGARMEQDSALPRAWANIIKNAPGIGQAPDGVPLADAEITIRSVPLVRKYNRQRQSNLFVTGIGSQGLAVRPGMKPVSGRMFEGGKRELIVGVTASQNYAGLELGDRIAFPDGNWLVVGTFATGTLLDSNLVGDAEMVKSAFRRGNYSSMTIRLASENSFDAFKTALIGNPSLRVTVERQSDYARRLAQTLPRAILIFAYLLGTLVGLGALSATFHTMYGTVDSRAGEIAILRAIGFGGMAVAASVVLEAMLLASAGAVIGTFLVWWWLDGYVYGGVMRISVTLHLFLIALVWALVIAFLGALAPAMRAARVTVVEALRS